MRLHGKRRWRVLTLVLATYAGSLLAVQVGLWYAKPRLEVILARAFNGPVRLGSLRVTPLFHIRTRGLMTPVGSIGRLRIAAHPDWFGWRGFVVTACESDAVTLRGSQAQLIEAWRSLLRGNAPVRLSPRTLFLIHEGRWEHMRFRDTKVKVRFQTLQAEGDITWDADAHLIPGMDALVFAGGARTLRYALHATYEADRVQIERLTLSAGALHLFVSGRVESLQTAPQAVLELAATDPERPVTRRWFRPSRADVAPPMPPPPASSPPTLHYLAGQLRITRDQLMIERLSAMIGDLPFSLAGSIRRRPGDAAVQLQLVSASERTIPRHADDPFTWNVSTQGTLADHTFRGNARATVGVWAQEHPVTLAGRCESCVIRITGEAQPELSFVAKRLALDWPRVAASNASTFRLAFEHVSGRAHVSPHRLELAQWTGAFGGGTVTMEGTIDFGERSPHARLQLAWRDVEAAELLAWRAAPYQLRARVDGEATVSGSLSGATLEGHLRTAGGTFTDAALLQQAFGFLGIAAPDPVPLQQATAAFRVTPSRCELTDVVVESAQFQASGRQAFDAEGRLDGMLSVRVSQELARTSWKLRLLLALLGAAPSDLVFDFDIGGFVSAPHLQWKENEFRQSVKRFLPRGMQVKLERDVERAIAALE